MANNLIVTKEQLDHLTNVIIKKLHGNVKLSQETIDKISKEIDLSPIIKTVINSLPIPKDGINGVKGEDGKDAEVSEEIISIISIEVLKKVSELFTQPKNGIDGRQGEKGLHGSPGRDGLIGPQGAVGFRGPQGDKGKIGVKGSIGLQGQSGLAGKKGDQGPKGDSGQDGVITDDHIQKVIELLDLSNHITKKELNGIIKKLLQDLALGRLELPIQELGGGLSGPHLINEINRVLGNEGWQEHLPYDGVLGANLDYVNFTKDTDTAPDQEGVIDWNDVDFTINVNTGLGPSLQVGQEFFFLVHNGSGIIINNGDAVYPVGSVGGRVSVELANAGTHVKITGAVALATMDIPIDGIGFVTDEGKVRGVDTSTFFPDQILWIHAGAGNDGKLTNDRPSFPNYAMQIGVASLIDAVNGEITVKVAGQPQQTIVNFFNGIFRESIDFSVSSDGATVTGTLQPDNGHDDMTMMFSDGFTILDTEPPLTIALIDGTDDVPQQNFVYIPFSTKLLTISASDWPTAEHIKVANLFIRSAATTQTDGVLVDRNWNDHIQSTTSNQGHMPHIAEKLRQFEAQWDSGVQGSASGFPVNVHISSTAGVIYQLHRQTFPALSMPTDDIHVVNNFTAPYVTVTNLNTQTLDASGSALANRSFSFVVWGVQNKTGQQSHLMCNLPTASYAKNAPSLAVSDASNFSVYIIPKAFQGVGFLIARFTMVLEADGVTWSLFDTEDLRGRIPNSTAGGGGTGGGVTEWIGLSDTQNSYVGFAGRSPVVNQAETALEFAFSPITVLNAATYTLLVTDTLVHVTYTTTGPVTSFTIPSALIATPIEFTINDGGGNAGTNSITIDTEGAETIDGAATFVISLNNESITLYSHNGNLYTR